jgi:hypothetical protein
MTLMYDCDKQETISKLANSLQIVAPMQADASTDQLPAPDLSEDTLTKYTKLRLSVPRLNISNEQQFYALPQQTPPTTNPALTPSTYVTPLKTFGLRLLQARSVKQVDDIVQEMLNQNGANNVANLIKLEKAHTVASATVKQTTDAIDELCQKLWET